MTPTDMAALHAAAMDTRPWSADEFESLLASGARAIGDPHAFALYRVTADEAELLTIATLPSHRRCGLARALLADLHTATRNSGATRVLLEVASANAPARALYASAGYREVGRRPDYYRLGDGTRDAAIVMERPLRPAEKADPDADSGPGSYD
jgi:ribosomal-protein-alanine N-acetyltransferase